MKFFEDHDQLESYLERFVTGWQVALRGPAGRSDDHDGGSNDQDV